MPRPKGSKNKKSLQALATVDDKIAAAKAEKEKLENEQVAIAEEIKTKKQLLKDNKKAVRKTDKLIQKLEADKEQADAQKIEEAKKAELESIVQSLLSSGQSAEDIIAKIQG